MHHSRDAGDSRSGGRCRSWYPFTLVSQGYERVLKLTYHWLVALWRGETPVEAASISDNASRAMSSKRSMDSAG